jgi:hypothetical protein
LGDLQVPFTPQMEVLKNMLGGNAQAS